MVIANEAGKHPVHIVVYDEDFMDFLCNALAFYNLRASGTLHHLDWVNDADTQQFDTVLVDISLEKDKGKQLMMTIKTHPRFMNTRVIILSSFAVEDEHVTELGADGALKIPFELPDLINKLGGSMQEPVVN